MREEGPNEARRASHVVERTSIEPTAEPPSRSVGSGVSNPSMNAHAAGVHSTSFQLMFAARPAMMRW